MAHKKAVFLSYASQDAEAAGAVCEALRARGVEVWLDQSELRGGDAWDAAIRRQIRECALFVPLISGNTEARGEGYFRLEWKLAVERCQLQADDQPFLFPVAIDATPEAAARVPEKFRERQWMRVDGAAGLAELAERVDGVLHAAGAAAAGDSLGDARKPAARGAASAQTTPLPPRLSICVLPFANMSGDPEQEYFSDGISEDIITDLSKVSALSVTARNTAFTFKGRAVDVRRIAGQLSASHVLEGSVRKAGGRVRITAQLIDGASGLHVWAERYDRNLDDIFALQDEIATAIVAALRLKLLPEERRAIERRGTSSSQAYKIYLMAHQMRLNGNLGSARWSGAIVRLCTRAIEIDAGYARAWALMAVAQAISRMMRALDGDGGRAAAQRALALDASLAEGHAAMAQVLGAEGRLEEAWSEIEKARDLDPDSFDVNNIAARLCLLSRRFSEAIPLFEKAAEFGERNFHPLMLLVSCLKAVGANERIREVSRRLLHRAERVALEEPDNGSAMNAVIIALSALGESERAREWIERGLLLDPDNLNMRYNIACTLAADLQDREAALGLLEPLTQVLLGESIRWMKADSDLDPIRGDPRFVAMIEAAERRLGESSGRESATGTEER
jgi:adenylate cyclase